MNEIQEHYHGALEDATRVDEGVLERKASLSGAYLCDRREGWQ